MINNTNKWIVLEQFWNRYCEKKLSLFCAYLKNGFVQHSDTGLHDICNCHSKIIAGDKKQLKEVIYSATEMAN
jgi:hypothetical protein